jgi:transcriptional regulator with XRE-family HTH domain
MPLAPPITAEAIGLRIRDLRGARTQGDVAPMAMLTQSHWSKIERGAVKRLPLDLLARIAWALGVPLDEITSAAAPADDLDLLGRAS